MQSLPEVYAGDIAAVALARGVQLVHAACTGFRVSGLGFRVWGLGFRVRGWGAEVEGVP